MRRGLNRLDTFYNLGEPQEEENTAMIAKCSYYRPTRKAFDWFARFKKEESFGFGLVTAVQSDPITPIKFIDAWNHKDQEQHKLWRDAIQKELNSMNKRNIWSIVPITEMPNGRIPIGNKWVLKIKRDGRY